MNSLEHVPWTIGIMLFACALSWLGVPPSFIGATGGLLFCLTREETQREYQIIEKLNPPLRAGLHIVDAFKFWQWNAHSKIETIVAVLAGYGAATALHLATGL
jgi:hypothetical protein